MLRIRDVFPGSRIRLFSIPDPNYLHPGSLIRIKEFKYFNPKNGFQALENIIQVVHPGSRIRMLTFYQSRIPDPGVIKAPDPGSRIRIRNTAFIYHYMFLAWAIGGAKNELYRRSHCRAESVLFKDLRRNRIAKAIFYESCIVNLLDLLS